MNLKDLVDVISTVLSTVVLVVGGIYAYLKFIKERPLAAQANISQEIIGKKLDSKHTLVHVQITIDNAGTTMLSVCKGYTCVQQILPLHESIATCLDKDPVDESQIRLNWPVIAERAYQYTEDEFQIGVGETERFDCDLLIPVSVKTIVVYSSFYFGSDADALLWEVTTYFDIPPDGSGSARRVAAQRLRPSVN